MNKCCIGSLIIITSTAGIIFYKTYKNKENKENKENKIFCDAETQTTNSQLTTVTPPNETNLPGFITIDTSDITTMITDNVSPRRSVSFASFFDYIRRT